MNLAARIEPLAEPGGICISEPVFGQVRNKIPNRLEKMEPQTLKNVRFPVDIYRVVLPWAAREVSAARTGAPRLAFLPFVNISPDPNDEYFADGLTEEFIARLSLLKGSEVIARTSVMAYKKKERGATQIGKELGVGTLLEGSVRRAGSRIRVTTQLIDANTEGHLWAESYDRNLEDIFAVQSEIAERVASSLQLQLLEGNRKRIGRRGTSKVVAYTLLLKGRLRLNRWDQASVLEAIKHFEGAIALDPKHVAAHAGLASAYAALGFLEALEAKEAYPKAVELARKALQLDEGLPEAHVALAASLWNQDLEAVEKALRKAIDLDPNYVAVHRMLADALVMKRRWADAVREIESAGNAGTAYLYARRYDAAIKHLKDAVELDPKAYFYLENLGLAHIQKGMLEEGLEEVARAAKALGSSAGSRELAYAYVKVGKPEEARALLAELLRSSEEGRGHSISIGAV